MKRDEWIRLWILDELVSRNSPLSRLVRHPTADGSPYWAFPGRAAIQASEEGRTTALMECVQDGLVDIYPRAWLGDKRFDSQYPLKPSECRVIDPDLLEEYEAVITWAGHQKWEADFQPDWDRFWLQVDGFSYDESNHSVTCSVLYTSNESWNELASWLPMYWGLDKQIGLMVLACDTCFQFSATAWKLLPVAKIVKLAAISDDINFFQLLNDANGCASNLNNNIPNAKKYLQGYLSSRNCELIRAIGILCDLSKLWKCDLESASSRRDAEPVMKVSSR